MTQESPSSGVRRIGSDRVVVSAGCVIIEAAAPMDWPVREFYRVPVYFEGRKYYVRGCVEADAPFAKRYELAPWPAHQPEQTTRLVVYDEAYVAERDAVARTQRASDRWHIDKKNKKK